MLVMVGLESQEQEGEESHASDEALREKDQSACLLKQLIKCLCFAYRFSQYIYVLF